MEAKNLLKLTFLSLILTSCGLVPGMNNSDTAVDSSVSRSSSSYDENLDDMESLEIESFVDAEAQETPAPQSFTAQAETDELGILGNINSQSDSIPEIMPAMMGGDTKNYTVTRGETLMQIAFKIYGDVSKWKEIKAMNPQISGHMITAGTILKYEAPQNEFIWQPTGTPYMIKTGDTLGTISNHFYMTTSKWKDLWNHNKKLIKNPHMIYAGFTMYAPEDQMGFSNNTNSEAPTHSNFEIKSKAPASTLEKQEITEEISVENVLSGSEKSIKSLKQDITVSQLEEDELIDETIQSLSSTQRIQLEEMLNDDSSISKELEALEQKYGTSTTK